MKKVIEILEDKSNDRYIFLFIDKDKENEFREGIYNINFHQGIGEILFDFCEENPHLTEIWRRLSLCNPKLDSYFLINKSIELYVEAYIMQSI